MSTVTSCASPHLGPGSSPLLETVQCPSAPPSIYRCLAPKSVSIWHRVPTDWVVNFRTNMSTRSSSPTYTISLFHTRSLAHLVSRWLWGHKVPSDSISTKVILSLQRRIARPSSAFLLKHNSPPFGILTSYLQSPPQSPLPPFSFSLPGQNMVIITLFYFSHSLQCTTINPYLPILF